mmetsp:Transcript_57193/g.145049  ORF Transcript_57193/g.145049 Transcript_57193/m.145049 type:complete len:215 (+) Transcript_57193:1-645(+)
MRLSFDRRSSDVHQLRQSRQRPCDGLASVLGVEVQADVDGRARLRHPQQEAVGGAGAIWLPNDDLPSNLSRPSLRIKCLQDVPIHGDLEEISPTACSILHLTMADTDLACETPFCTWVHHHRDGLRIAECANHTILMPGPTLLTSPLAVETRRGGDDGDGCVDDCQVDLHVVAGSTRDKEVPAFAHVVWTPRRRCRGLRAVLGWVDGLPLIRVP